MLKEYLDWPSQVRKALDSWDKYLVKGNFDEVLVVGMGGSGIVGDFLQVLSHTRRVIPVYVSKSHILPRFVDEETLVLAVSYSGDTLETVIALKKALNSGAKIAVVSSGGILENEARRYGLIHIPLPTGLLPRVSLPSMLYAILGLLDTSGYSIVSRNEAYESMLFLEKTLDESVERGVEIARWIKGKVIDENRLLILASHSPLEALLTRARNEFNENSKIMAKIDVAPEWMHNDIVGYESPVGIKLGVLEITDPDDKIGSELVKFMEEIYLNQDIVFHRLQLHGRNLLEKLMYGSLVSGVASVKLAEIRGVDPASTKSIVQYKKLSKKIFGVEDIPQG